MQLDLLRCINTEAIAQRSSLNAIVPACFTEASQQLSLPGDITWPGPAAASLLRSAGDLTTPSAAAAAAALRPLAAAAAAAVLPHEVLLSSTNSWPLLAL
jgi:hypothetical protein